MKKILVIGSSGAGKSTFSRKLSEILNIELIHLDRIYWKPNWVESEHEDFDKLLGELLSKPEWIMDGNYGRTMARRIAASDAVIMLDINRLLCTFRILYRVLEYRGRSRPDIAEGCREKVDWEFLKFTWNFPERSREKVMKRLLDVRRSKAVFVLNSRNRVNHFLDHVKKAGNLESVEFGRWN